VARLAISYSCTGLTRPDTCNTVVAYKVMWDERGSCSKWEKNGNLWNSIYLSN